MVDHAPTLYRSAALTTRLHTRLRWWSCPFSAVDAAVPASGSVLEVGCGHGLLSCELALRQPGRTVTGVDIDAGKIAQATRAATAGGLGARVSFDTVPAGFAPTGSYDALVICDVLYLLPADDQRELVTAAARCLAPGGVVVLKEMDLEPRWKFRWNHIQETLASRVLPITDSVGHGMTFVAPTEMAHWLTDAGLDTDVRRCDRHYPWPHVLVTGNAPT